MNRPLIKICGLRQAGDVQLCADLGIDWNGFIFHPPSPRNILPKEVAALPATQAKKVGVFVKQSSAEVLDIMSQAKLNLAQLHGDQNQDFCQQIGPQKVIKVFWPQRFASQKELKLELQNWTETCAYFLFDAGISGGGHGKSLDFAMFKNLNSPRPWLLAGGLGPDNIKNALQACSPFGLDLNSGVEEKPGIKNKYKLQQIVEILNVESRHTLSLQNAN